MNNYKTIGKKILLVLALSSALFSCSNVGDGEFVLEGSVKNVPDGKKIILETLDDKLGIVPFDTVQIKGGKFKFTGKISEPSLYSISIQDVQSKSFAILESGEKTTIEINKDTIFLNKISGTENNDQLTEFNGLGFKIQKKLKAFEEANKAKMQEAMAKQDTVVINKLRKEYGGIQKEMETKGDEFVKAHPKSFVSLLLVQSLFNNYMPDLPKIEKSFNGLDASMKNTKVGKNIAKKLKDMKGVAVGRKAPDFSAPNPEGKMVSLKESLGKVTLIDFWASWCGPCRAENPAVLAIYNEYHPKGLNIISVSLDKPGEADKWKEAIQKDHLMWTHISNLKWWQDPIAIQYGVSAIPSNFLLSQNGFVVAKDLHGEALKSKLKELLQ
ncbi:MAG TPA: TlpA disulfide reductase family protein [Flavobacterium sp.]|nr:TlpA disulfide reductase family protein [Flavobacterium sp.]